MGTFLFCTDSKQALTLILLIILASCAGGNTVLQNQPPIVQGEKIPDGLPWSWPISTPETQGMDSEILADMLYQIQDEDYAIDSVMVLRNGFVLLDAMVYPFQRQQKHIIHSCTKSIMSALIGIAIEQGFISCVGTPVLDFFPAVQLENLDEIKQSMTLQDLLTMSTGLNCRDSYLYNWRGLDDLWASDDWVEHILSLPMSDPPGTRFEYCNSASLLLSAIIQETTGMKASQFAEQNLFDPLGILDYEWRENPEGITIGWGDLYLMPHDMAKIGQLYLDGGVWGSQRIVTADWVAESTRQQVPAFTLEDGYGYQWWIDHDGIYMALGYRGQFIFIVPERQLVVVFTSDLEDNDFFIPEFLLKEYIISAAVSSEAIPEDPRRVQQMERLIDALGAP
jgi:CubicO group peptidase (beta-lactamase class C family)